MDTDSPDHPLRVLLVDDDEDDYVLARDLLLSINDPPMHVVWANTYAKALDLLLRNEHDVCLLDYHLGAHTGIELLQEASAGGCQVPFIFLTGQGSRGVDLQAMRDGAVYYLDKNRLDVYDLERAIRYSLERAQMLRVVQNVNARLEERVLRRTAELSRVNHELALEVEQRKQAEQRLLEALEIERDTNRLKTEFITTMSHEFRTPLAIIQSSTDILRRYEARTTPEQRQARYEQIVNQVQWMTGLLDSLFAVQQAQEGDIIVTRRHIDLNDFCQTLVKGLRPTVKANQHLSFECDCNTVFALLDEALLRQILYNLLTNAVKFSPEGGAIRLCLACARQEATFTVTDEGIGILPEDMPIIFDTFRRGTNVGNIGGTGLGLAIVAHSVKLLGGTVTAESEPDVRTIFTVCLPFTVSHA